MVYFDNAATGGHKPKQVSEAVLDSIKRAANPGRAAHKRALKALQTVTETRENLLMLLGGAENDNVVFTKNCTEALNLALLGTIKEGGHVVSSVLEHNSVLRPLCELQKQGIISYTLVNPDSSGKIGANQVLAALQKDTYAVALTAASNVTGTGADLDEIGRLCLERGLLFIVDGAQFAGHGNISLSTQEIDLLCLPGHKGLLGPAGTGALLFKQGVQVSPILMGGTGTDSQNICQPDIYPEALESGTLNLCGIAGLNEGVKYLLKHRAVMESKTRLLSAALSEGFARLSKIKVHSKPNRCGIFSFLIDGQNSTETADILSARHEIAVRSGLHCAPLAHKWLQTQESGLVRVSVSAFNTLSEVSYLLSVLEEMCS